MSQIILFSYPESPFAKKLELVLLFKRLPYSICTVTRMPPRPALITLGINYRRIPVLSIGNELYVDTSIAVLALEELFPSHSLSGRNWGLQTTSAFFWSDRQMFSMASGLLDWGTLPKEFIVDRSSYRGSQIDTAKMVAARPMIMSTMRAHIALLESQLISRSSNSNFILDTSTPTYLDITLYFILAWIISFKTAPNLFTSSESPLVSKWMEMMKSSIDSVKKESPNGGKIPRISSEEATKIIQSTKPNTSQAINDDQEPLLLAKWLVIGNLVDVTPDDTGKVSTRGKLVAINRQRSIIEVVGENGGKCRVIAPKLGFSVTAAK